MKVGIKTLAIMAVLAIVAFATQPAQGTDLEEGFNVTSDSADFAEGLTGTTGLIDNAECTYDWGGYNSQSRGSGNGMRFDSYSGGGRMQFRWATQGQYVVTLFSTGGGAPLAVTNIIVDEEQANNDARVMVRDSAAGNQWWISESFFSSGTNTVEVAAVNWFAVNESAAVNAAAAGATFAAITIDGTAKTWAETAIATIDGAGIYVETTMADSTHYSVGNIIWTDATPVDVPDVRGLTVAEATPILVGAGLVVGTSHSVKCADENPSATINDISPDQYTAQLPGTTVNMALSPTPGIDQAWSFTVAGPADISTAANFQVIGADVDGLDAGFNDNAAIDATERMIIANGGQATLSGATDLTVPRCVIMNNSKLTISNGRTLTVQRFTTANGYNPNDAVDDTTPQNDDYQHMIVGHMQIGYHGNGSPAVNLTSGVGELVLDGGHLFGDDPAATRGQLNIGVAPWNGADVGVGNGTVTVKGASTVQVYTIQISQTSLGGTAKESKGIGLLVLEGSAATVNTSNNLVINTDQGTIKWVADASGLTKIVSANNTNINDGNFEIDLTALPKPTAPTTYVLTECSNLLQGDGLTGANGANDVLGDALITPMAGSDVKDWSVVVDGLTIVLKYEEYVASAKEWSSYK